MTQEQSSGHQHQLPKYGTGSATGVARASKKNKPRKIPQRGLGVAQLEKLRLEEQKKMEGGGGVSVLAPAAHSFALSGCGGGHLLPLHPPSPPVPLSAISRPPADGSLSPVLWDPAGPHETPVQENASTSNGEHGLVTDGVVEPPNGAPFKPNVQQQEQHGTGAGRGGQGIHAVKKK